MRKTIHATAGALAALLAGSSLTARAADMSMAPIYQPESGPMVEFGTGWYLRGDVGYATLSAPTMSAGTLQIDRTSTPLGGLFNSSRQGVGVFGATLGTGYQFNPWFRMDATGDYRQQLIRNVTSPFQTFTAQNGVVNTGCYLDQPVETSVVNGVPQYQTQPVPNGGCYRVDTETVQTWTGLLNAYGDLGNWFGITPYIGGGIGLTHIRTSASENWFWNNGQSYGPANTYTSATGVAFHYGYLGNVGPSQNLNNFSWALMAGLSYDIAPHLKFDLGYRYLNMGSVTTGNSVRVTVDSQEVRAGLRFTPDL